jgi:maltooligosyltrehalose trehalohydrolase
LHDQRDMQRRYPLGAEIIDGGVHFRVWAPAHDAVAVSIDGRDVPLARDGGGYHAGRVDGAGAGTLYRFRLGGGRETVPDPASRFQPEGPHGPSMVVDPSAYRWKNAGVAMTDDVVLYEMHVGTFTAEGTFRAAIEKLPLLRDVGITLIEVMPIAEFPGRFGWGYDGVDLWAPTRLYGRPDDFRAFVDAAHGAGLGVILDVVYNHFGPDGCYLKHFTEKYFTKKYTNDWGEAINYDGDGSAAVRELVSENAAYWVDEFRLDGLRLDATQSINDDSDEHVIALIARRAREAAGGRRIVLVAENEPQEVRLLTEYGLDALWNDDWHHSATVALTGRREAYYTDYLGTPQEFVSMAKSGFLYQGQWYSWQKNRRGTPSSSIAPRRFVCYLQNHDQVANSADGERIDRVASPANVRAMTALLLLAPQTPMLFQGQEFAASSPFLYFADHEPELAAAVAKGRREFLTQFPSIATAAAQAQLAPPESMETFLACKLDWRERDAHGDAVALHRDLSRMRAEWRAERVDGAVLRDALFVLRFETRLLLVNLGDDVALDPVDEPLLAGEWTPSWSSGPAMTTLWRIPGHAAIVLTSATSGDRDR